MKFWGPPNKYLGAPRLGAPHKNMGAPFLFGGPWGPQKNSKLKEKRGGPQRKKPMDEPQFLQKLGYLPEFFQVSEIFHEITKARGL